LVYFGTEVSCRSLRAFEGTDPVFAMMDVKQKFGAVIALLACKSLFK
jgi:hypothetical protein